MDEELNVVLEPDLDARLYRQDLSEGHRCLSDDAVRAAYNISRRGETVLLSPACASFDLFENFEDRGNQFKKAIKNL